jgi:type VI secretion system protein ImpK
MGHKEAVEQHDAPPASGTAPTERLPLLYQGIFTAITRIQAGKPVPDQRKIEHLLGEIEREAVKAGYEVQDVREHSHYAVVAFLDETIQRSSVPGADRWRALQAKLYNTAKAGEAVYDHLKSLRSRKDSPELADILEVYCLCFLLGFEGQYALGRQSELPGLAA